MISFALDEEDLLLKETASRFARDHLRPGQRQAEESLGISDDLQARFNSLGLHLTEIDPEARTPFLHTAILQEELSFGDPGAAVALPAPHGAGPALVEMASEEQRARLLPELLSGGRGAVAYSERYKARAAGFGTVALPVKDGYLLSGIKSFVINASTADLTVVFAQVNPDTGWDGFGVFVTEGRPGTNATFRPGDRHELLGLSAMNAGELIFEDHFVPEENRLRGGGDLLIAAQRFFARQWLVAAARQVGLARAAYEYALEFTQDRRAFGKPVAHFQAIAFALADMHMDVESARLLLYQACVKADQGHLDLRLCATAAEHASEASFRVADQCVQLLGGAGFICDYPAEKWLRESKALSLISGCAEVYQQIIAAEELGHALDVELQKQRPGQAPSLRHGLPGCLVQPIFT